MTPDQVRALHLLRIETQDTFNIWKLRGKELRAKRQEIMSLLCGVKVTRSNSGVLNIYAKLTEIVPKQRGENDYAWAKRIRGRILFYDHGRGALGAQVRSGTMEPRRQVKPVSSD